VSCSLTTSDVAVRFAKAIHTLSDLEGSHFLFDGEDFSTDPLVDCFLHRSRGLPVKLHLYYPEHFAILATHYVNQSYSSDDVDTERLEDNIANSLIDEYLCRSRRREDCDDSS
jgi:hypothetical protein